MTCAASCQGPSLSRGRRLPVALLPTAASRGSGGHAAICSHPLFRHSRTGGSSTTVRPSESTFWLPHVVHRHPRKALARRRAPGGSFRAAPAAPTTPRCSGPWSRRRRKRLRTPAARSRHCLASQAHRLAIHTVPKSCERLSYCYRVCNSDVQMC